MNWVAVLGIVWVAIVGAVAAVIVERAWGDE